MNWVDFFTILGAWELVNGVMDMHLVDEDSPTERIMTGLAFLLVAVLAMVIF